MLDDFFFPFSNVPDEDLLNTLGHSDVMRHQVNENFDPFSVQDDNYNNDLDVNQFYIRSRHITFPKSEYIFLNEFPSFGKDSNFCLLTLNIRSVSTNFQYFKDTMLSNSIIYDVLGLTETRLDSDISSLYNLPSHTMFSNNRNRYGGGVTVYLSNKYTGNMVDSFNYMEAFVECVGVEAKFNGKIFLFLCIYRPPQGNVDAFLNTLNEILVIAKDKNYNELFIFGDLNLNLLLQNNANIKDLNNLMYSYSLFPLTTLPTRVTDTSATIIDQIWSTYLEHNTGNYIVKTDITDHFPVISLFKCNNFQSSPVLKTIRSFTQEALDAFYNLLLHIDWSQVINCSCPNNSYNMFYSIFKKKYDECFPVKTIKVSSKSIRSPHITPALKKSITEKHRLEKLAYKWPLSFKERYKTYRNRLTSILKAAKKRYYQDQLVANQGNPRSHWKSINNILGKTTDDKNSKIDLKPLCNNIPEKFNEHFMNVGQLIENAGTDYLDYLQLSPNFSLYLTPATDTEVENCIKAFKTNSSGYDDISPIVLKKTANIISNPLTYIVNLTLKTGIFPDALKKAKVIPLLKSGSKSDIKNYRPISILPAFSKIFEKIINHRLVTFLENNNLLTDSQHGFRPRRSTETALLQFTSNVYHYLEKKRHLIGVFLDFSKAFDTLSHTILLDKLCQYGIRGVTLKLFQSYLTNRSQSVYCNSTHSSFSTIKKGVPQGSILGPTLFLIYINDIVNVSAKFKYIIYADDTTLLIDDSDINNLHGNLILELEKISSWTRINNLSLNTNKTNFIFFQNRSVRHNFPPVTITGNTVDRVKFTKFLGVYLDENINWNQHISFTVNKLARMCGILYRIRNNLTPEAITSIYYTLCYPHLTYCVAIWACTWQTFIKKVTIAQNKIFRCMFFMSKFESTRNITGTQNFLTFINIHKYFLCYSIFKYFTQYRGDHPFKLVNTPYNTRGNDVNLICPQFRTTLFKLSILCTGPQIWNTLPLNVKTLLQNASPPTFKKSVKTHLYNCQNL